MKFEVYEINIILEHWGDEPEDFFMQVHCEVRAKGYPGGEAFVVNIVSPKALERELTRIDNDFAYEFGRGLLITTDYKKSTVLAVLQKLVDNANAQTWDDLIEFVNKYFDWV